MLNNYYMNSMINSLISSNNRNKYIFKALTSIRSGLGIDLDFSYQGTLVSFNFHRRIYCQSYIVLIYGSISGISPPFKRQGPPFRTIVHGDCFFIFAILAGIPGYDFSPEIHCRLVNHHNLNMPFARKKFKNRIGYTPAIPFP